MWSKSELAKQLWPTALSMQCDCRTSKTKLVAYNGKLIRVEEAQAGESPNGSGFVITTQAAPQLDATNLVVGHVVDGMDIVQQLTKLPTVKSNNSVFFKYASGHVVQ